MNDLPKIVKLSLCFESINTHTMFFPTISPKQSFPALESEILAYWKANDTFRKSVESRPADNPYRFYDGPPFITGTPH